MESSSSDLAARIRERGLPEIIARIATEGGAEVHADLDYRAQSVWDPSWAVVEDSGLHDLVPLWTCGTTTMFSRADGSFTQWDAEEEGPSRTYPDFPALVRCLLTDLFEDDVEDEEREVIARLLLPVALVDGALELEPR